MTEASTRPWWVSWYGTGEFEYNGPWWRTGFAPDDEGEYTIGIFVAAVMADSDHDAQQAIQDAHDAADGIDEWRFTERCPHDWTPPFGGRFPRAEWMRWPWPE